MIEIPAERLNAEIMTAIIEEFILREGTDYGAQEVDFSSKVAQVMALLKAGEVTITFDPKTENCTLLTRQQFHREVAAATHAESKADDDASIYEDYCQDQGGVE
ncbi:YheU family protein [Porticoccaceae bacterium]|nr:YheU family protein [Porticoccaceae bacterium]